MKWQINAQVVKSTASGRTVRQVPTFFLDGNIQGIVGTAHAAKIAREVIDPYGELETHIHVIGAPNA